MTIGDILAVIAAILLTGAAWGATVLLTLALFPGRVQHARETLLTRPAVCGWRGAAIVLILGVFTVRLMSVPGPARLIALIIAGFLIAAAAVGGAAIVRSVSDRIATEGSDMTVFARLTRATTLFVLAGFLPVVGWFVVVPAVLVVAVGAATARRLRTPKAISAQSALPTFLPEAQ